jgi:hypothetical protein
MEYIEPKPKLGSKVVWTVSDNVKSVVKYYAEYTGYTEDEIVDTYLSQLRDDPKFKEWLLGKRRNKRAISQVFPSVAREVEDIG